jgi:hypothetical protein
VLSEKFRLFKKTAQEVCGRMRAKTILAATLGLAIFGLQACFHHEDNDWYQGRRGRWYQQQDAWRFRDMDGNEYREENNHWLWYNH